MVLDTHAFIWFAEGDSRLPMQLYTKMQAEPNKVYVPSVCLWEAILLAEKGKLKFGSSDPGQSLRGYLKATGFSEAPLTAEIALLSRELAFNHEDPADRFIAATAKALGMPLVTFDHRLRELPWLNVAS